MKGFYDFHIHSCLSPCGDEDMTPNNIVNMAYLNELNVIAVADHNTTANVPAVMRVAEQRGITVLPAMELETAEEIHVLCLFRSLEGAQCFEKECVRPALPDIKNRTELFGRQLILDENDEIIGEDERYLINATALSVDSLATLLRRYDGLPIPAHIDKQTKSMCAVFGYFDRSMGYTLAELSKNVPSDFLKKNSALSEAPYFFLHDSDAHYLEDIAERTDENFLTLECLDLPHVFDFLLKKAGFE